MQTPVSTVFALNGEWGSMASTFSDYLLSKSLVETICETEDVNCVLVVPIIRSSTSASFATQFSVIA